MTAGAPGGGAPGGGAVTGGAVTGGAWAARICWSALVLVVAALSPAAAYAGAVSAAALAGCVVLPFVLIAAGTAVRLPRWAVASAVTCMGTALGLAAAGRFVEPAGAPTPGWRDSPGLRSLGPLIDAVPRLLTSPRPAPAEPEYLAPVAVLVWLTATVVALVTVSRRRAPRLIAPLVGAVLIEVTAALITAGAADRHGVIAAGTAVLIGIGWTALGGAPGRLRSGAAGAGWPGRPLGAGRPRFRAGWFARRARRLSATGGVAGAAVLALLAGVLPAADAFEPRDHVPPPVHITELANPLPLARMWASRPDLTLFTVARAGGPVPARIRLAALPDYDGAGWTLAARLRAPGVVDRPELPLGEPATVGELTVTVRELTGGWLPSVGLPEAVTGLPAVADVDTGTLVTEPEPEPGARYVLRTRTDPPTAGRLAAAQVPPSEQARRYLQLPNAPQWLVEGAQEAVVGADTPWARVARLVEVVRRGRALDPKAPAGTSYARIEEFLTATPETGGGCGTSEQFAATLALLARAVGVPSRVAVGFVVRGDGAGPVAVTGADSRVWTEVYLAGVGWVAVDASPDEVSLVGANAAGLGETLVDPAAADPVPEPAAQTPAGTGSEPPAKADVTTPTRGRGSALILSGGAAALAGAALLVLVGSRRARTVRLRRTGAPGAWQHVVDSACLAGLPIRAAACAPDLAADLEGRGATGATRLARWAELVAFAPPAEGAPSGEGAAPWPSAAFAAEAWPVARAAERGLRRSAPWWRRATWPASPAVFGRLSGDRTAARRRGPGSPSRSRRGRSTPASPPGRRPPRETS